MAFLRAAAAAGTPRLPAHLAAIAALRDAHGHDALTAALRRAVAFRRFRRSPESDASSAGSKPASTTSPPTNAPTSTRP